MTDAGHPVDAQRQRGTSRKFLSSDFRPDHLRLFYDMFERRIVDAFSMGR